MREHKKKGAVGLGFRETAEATAAYLKRQTFKQQTLLDQAMFRCLVLGQGGQ